MLKFLLSFLISIITFCTYAKVNAQLSSVKYIYTIDTIAKSFYKKVIVSGKFKEEQYSAKVYYSELEKIGEVESNYIDVKNKSKKLSKDRIYKSDVLSSTFYDGYKSQVLDYLKSSKELEYQSFYYAVTIINQELICLSRMDFYEFEEERIDTTIHEVHVPKKYEFIINFNDLKNDNKIFVDSITKIDEKVYFFKLIHQDVRKNKMENIPYHFVRVILVPRNSNPSDYFNNWYQSLISSIPSSNEYRKVCDSITRGLHSNDSIINTVYKYTQEKIRYIDIENGINAFRPRKCDDVILKQQGDCKDMAYLIYSMLVHKGIDAHLALNSTLDNECNFDFPSLSSANHLICVAYDKEKVYYLDATESYNKYNVPSRQIQGTNAFISGKENYHIERIPVMNPAYNEISNTYELKITNSVISGKFRSMFKGYSKLFIEKVVSKNTEINSKQLLKKYYQNKNYNATYNNITYQKSNDIIHVNGDVSLNYDVLSYIEGKYYLNFNFCPFVHQFNIYQDTTNNYPLYTTTKIKYSVQIEFPNEIKRVESNYKDVVYGENIKYQFNISKEKNRLLIEYEYINPYVKIEPNQMKEFNQSNNLISKTLNHEIIIY